MNGTSTNITRKITEFTDISLAFKPNPVTGDITLLKNERAVENSIKNCVLIAAREAAFNSDFGSTVGAYLFELIDEVTARDIEIEVRRTIRYNEPRVKLNDVRVTVSDDYNGYNVTVDFSVTGFDEINKVTFQLTPTTT
jgi:phage baseplate assembly protein W